MSAIKVVLERVLTPLPRNCPVQFDMPRRPIAKPVYSAQIFLVGAEFTKVYAHHYVSRVRTK